MSVTPLSSEAEQQKREAFLGHNLAGNVDAEVIFNCQWAEMVFSETPEPLALGNQLTIVHEDVPAVAKDSSYGIVAFFQHVGDIVRLVI